MEHEINDEPGNIAMVCGSCANKRHESWQEHHKELHLRVGDFVKVGLSIGDNADTEHMWVEITQFACEPNGFIKGKLRNDSLLCEWLTYGTAVNFKRTDISDYVKEGNFDEWKPWGSEVHHEG